MREVFKIDKNSKILIYGAVANGQKICNAFKGEGYNIVGFIDKRACEIKQVFGLPIWTLENIPKFKEVVVIITIKNVFEHCKIVRDLIDKGIHNIIYCPKVSKSIYDNESIKKMSSIYNKIINLKDEVNKKEITQLNLNFIPKTKEITLYEFKDYGLINKIENDMLIAYIPVEMIYTAQKIDEFDYNWEEKNILTLPHISLFEYFDGKNSLYKNQYMDFCIYTAKLNNINITEMWKENIIKSRHIVYTEMCKSLEMDNEFFINNAQVAVWNREYKYFNLNGGRHRVSFLCEKNYEVVPLKINAKYYNTYLNYEKLNNVINFIIKNKIDLVNTPIPHPYFYRFPARKTRYLNLIINTITRFISRNMLKEFGKIEFKNLSFLHIGYDDGALKRHFSKMGCDVIGYGECGEFESLLNNLFYVDNINYLHYDELKSYDIVYIGEEGTFIDDDLLKNILKNSQKYIFIESNKDDFTNIKRKVLSLQSECKYFVLKEFYTHNSNIELGVVLI